MSSYRQGAVLGFTIAEAFILLTFLLLIALVGLNLEDDPQPEPDTSNVPRVWERPEKIETLEQARTVIEALEQARAVTEWERDQALEKAEERRKAEEEAEQARKAREEAEQARAVAERERDQVRSALELIRRKGENPPCWYEVVDADKGKIRERAYYVFNVAICEDTFILARREAPLGGPCDNTPEGACDNRDRGRLYADEWKRLKIDDLPYGKSLNENEFREATKDLVAQGKNGQVRPYGCVFSVSVWDKIPDHSKKRWKEAHDRVIEGSFSAYTVKEDEWEGTDCRSVGGKSHPE